MRITLVVLACLVLGAGIGWLAGRWIGVRALWAIALAGLGLAGWLILAGRAAPGMEGLGLVLLAVLFVLPATVGGGVAAWLGARHQKGGRRA